MNTQSMFYGITANFRDFQISLLSLALLSISLTLGENMAMAQQQPQQQQPQTANSPVNSICQLIQDNRFIAGLTGLDQAVNICNNLNTIGSNQALSELCSIIGGFNIINVKDFCNLQNSNQDQQLQQQPQTLNNASQLPEANQSNSIQENVPSQSQQEQSGSIIDRLLNMLFGFLNVGS
ncbi:MAG TPA: hypothetical protein VFG45_08915 [Candidatus Nitrosocosmicus sp.]|nr:hypothetical protein [Candidatus Nitrosocosmicus sp.]